MAEQQDDARHRQLAQGDSHQLSIERNVPDFESTRDFSEDCDWFLSAGIGDDYPGDKSERDSHKSVPDRRDEEEGLG